MRALFRAIRYCWLLLLAIPLGCTKDEDYLKVFRDQRAAMHELADILAKVQDEKSMAAAQIELEQRRPKFEAIASKAKALPMPLPPEVRQRLEEDKYLMTAAVERVRKESNRISKLPEGENFLKQFESKSQGLMTAVQR
jgi:hypothetical protein